MNLNEPNRANNGQTERKTMGNLTPQGKDLFLSELELHSAVKAGGLQLTSFCAHEVRPCLAAHYNQPLRAGQARSVMAYALAKELHRAQWPHEAILKAMDHWNDHNNPPLPPKGLEKHVNNALSNGKQPHGCHHELLKLNCIGFDLCPYSPKTKPVFEADYTTFLTSKWPILLGGTRTALYCTIIALEKLSGRGVGGRIAVRQQRLMDLSGIASRNTIRSSLIQLADCSLITLKLGSPQIWKHRATEINRCIPVPECILPEDPWS